MDFPHGRDVMSQQDRNAQHSANGVGGSNNPAANPGQDKAGKRQGDETGQKRREEDSGGESDQKGQRNSDKDSQP
jgi:hypothetical protein